MVEAQRRLIDHLGIERLLAVAGGSMGGMQALQWVASYPERVASAIPIATTLKHSPQKIAFDEVGRQAIMADPAWNSGDYYASGQPEKGLAVARMIGHITYMSDQSMEEKFSRDLKTDHYSFSFRPDFEVEGYLRYRGDNFVKRFDANTYLYITRALDYFDLTRRHPEFLEFHKPAWSIAKFIEATETEDAQVREELMNEILTYNHEDLGATWAVLSWLRGITHA